MERSLDNKSENFSSESDTNCATSISLTFKNFNFSVPWICQLETVVGDMLPSFRAGFLTLYVQKCLQNYNELYKQIKILFSFF